MTGYNPRLRWLNERPRIILTALYLAASPTTDLEHVGLLTNDAMKAALLRWAEQRHGVASLEGLEAP